MKRPALHIAATAAIVLAISVGGYATGYSFQLVGWLTDVKNIDPATLHAWLGEGRQVAVIDVREPAEHSTGYIQGSALVPPAHLSGFLTRAGPPKPQPVAIVCEHGRRSQIAAARVKSHGYDEVLNLSGGLEAWRDARYPLVTSGSHPIDAEIAALPEVKMTVLEEWLVTITGTGLKPAYMVLALLFAVFIWRSHERGLVLLKHGLFWFFVGEAACALNFLFGDGGSDILELLHGAGMVVMGALAPWGALTLLDERIWRFFDKESRCVWQRFCGDCWKQKPVVCGLQRVCLFVAPTLALLAFMPWHLPIQPTQGVMTIFGTEVPWIRSVAVELVELRLYPVAAAALLLFAAYLATQGQAGLRAAQASFFWGIGLLSFSLMRFFLMRAYADAPAWGDIWEETTEFIAVVGVGWGLWVFRKQLGLWPLGSQAP